MLSFNMRNKIKILLIDDEIIYLEFLKKYMERNDIEADIENNPDSAIKKALSNNYDFVITDYFMPINNGITVLKEIKKHKPECNVIIHSNYLSEEIINIANENGAFGIYKKNEEFLLYKINESRFN